MTGYKPTCQAAKGSDERVLTGMPCPFPSYRFFHIVQLTQNPVVKNNQ